MIELRNEEQRKKYIPRIWLKIFREDPEEFRDEFVDAGVLNYLYQVTSKNKTIFLKQALGKTKHWRVIGKDLASISMDRLKCEGRYIDIVKKFLPKGVEVPNILNYDEENNILALSDVKKDGILLETSMLNGNFNELTAYRLGEFLGVSNRNTMGKKIIIRGTPEDDLKNWHLFLNMRTRGILQREKFPDEVVSEIESLYNLAKGKYTKAVLVITDYCPKNVLERKDGKIGLVDFEQACGVGDLAFDLGFLMGHYLIIGVINKQKAESAIRAMKQILAGYNKEMAGLKDKYHDERLIKYAGAVMVYRITGSSKVGWIKSEDAPLIKEIGFHLITSSFKNGFDDVFTSLGKKLVMAKNHHT